MTKSQIAELRELKTRMAQDSISYDGVIYALGNILSRIEAEQGEGLREAVSKCPVHNKAIDTNEADDPKSYTCPEEKNGCIECPITKAFRRIK